MEGVATMKKLCWGLLGALLYACSAYAQPVQPSCGGSASNPCYTQSSGSGSAPTYTPVTGTQSALSVSSATGLTVPGTAQFALVTISSGGNVAFSLNSDYTPTAAQTSNLITYGQPLWLSGASVLSAAKFIDVTGSTATLFIQYFK